MQNQLASQEGLCSLEQASNAVFLEPVGRTPLYHISEFLTWRHSILRLFPPRNICVLITKPSSPYTQQYNLYPSYIFRRLHCHHQGVHLPSYLKHVKIWYNYYSDFHINIFIISYAVKPTKIVYAKLKSLSIWISYNFWNKHWKFGKFEYLGTILTNQNRVKFKGMLATVRSRTFCILFYHLETKSNVCAMIIFLLFYVSTKLNLS